MLFFPEKIFGKKSIQVLGCDDYEKVVLFLGHDSLMIWMPSKALFSQHQWWRNYHIYREINPTLLSWIVVIPSYEGCLDKNCCFTLFVATHQASQRLDIDLLVVDNIDELKNFKAPAALRRGHKPLPDSVNVSLSCYAGNGQQKYGMNLGVALLKPSRETLEKMLDVVKSRDRTHQATNGPEQDFLILASDFSSWFSLILIPILFIKALQKKTNQ